MCVRVHVSSVGHEPGGCMGLQAYIVSKLQLLYSMSEPVVKIIILDYSTQPCIVTYSVRFNTYLVAFNRYHICDQIARCQCLSLDANDYGFPLSAGWLPI